MSYVGSSAFQNLKISCLQSDLLRFSSETFRVITLTLFRSFRAICAEIGKLLASHARASKVIEMREMQEENFDDELRKKAELFNMRVKLSVQKCKLDEIMVG